MKRNKIILKRELLFIFSIIFFILLLPNVFSDACTNLPFENCNGFCKPTNIQTYTRHISFYQCSFTLPSCNPGDIELSSEYYDYGTVCCDYGSGDCDYNIYVGYVASQVTCLGSFDCVSNCSSPLQTTCNVNNNIVCVNLFYDNNNCGSCGNACPQGMFCHQGECINTYIPSCGNNILDPGEECDGVLRCGGNPNAELCQIDNDCAGSIYGDTCLEVVNGLKCTPSYNGQCTYCSQTCTNVTLQGGYCGDGFCDNEESDLNCFKDCGNIPGWNSMDNGWYVNEEKRLVGQTTSNPINIYSDSFNVKVNKEYILSAEIFNPQQCSVYIDLNDGKCLSATDWSEKNCFNNIQLTSTGSFSIIFPNNVHSSEGIIRNVKIRIHVPNNCLVKFDNIYFKENSDVYHFNQPPIFSSGCCPDNYCWDGNECIIADVWNVSSKSNLWSGIDVTVLLNKHVNTSLQWLAKGYRCVLNDSGYADWKKVDIKYAWDFNESGYCIRESDCFVSHSFINTNNGGSSCIKDNEVISDNYLLGLGNHYCLNGTWASKEFLIANVLENITDNKPYVLFCGKDEIIFNKRFNNIAGGCVLVLKESNEERIITGFYFINESDTDVVPLWIDHCNNLGLDTDCNSGFTLSIDVCTNLNNDFYKCEIDFNDPRFYIYYNNKSKYFILSSDPVIEIENRFFNNLWNSIKRFFRKLFGYNQGALMLANQTKNYYNIYLVSNNTLKIRALEEIQYDESLKRNLAYMYINITGANNNLNIDYINSTLKGIYYEYESNANSLFLIIKYNITQQQLSKNYPRIWPYLTATNRDRP
ncbi:MAG: hypothetical protein QXK76_01365 [Candidatus Woesearchaeota archaeon]